MNEDFGGSLAKVSKALAGTLAGALVMFLAKNNIVIADGLNDALELVLGALITGAIVYLAPRNKN